MFEIVTAFFTLSLIEVLLGVDNIVILTVLADRLENPRERALARQVGLAFALVFRIVFLFTLTWIIRMDSPLWSLGQFSISIRDIILIVGGGFLIHSGTKEIIKMLREAKRENLASSSPDDYSTTHKKDKRPSLFSIIIEIAFLDVLFAMDSMVTAVALSDHILIMIAANVFAIILMLLIANWIARFLERNPAFKVLAVTFLVLVGISLVSDGLGLHIPKGYLYFAIGFSLAVEVINTVLRAKKSQ